MSKTTKKIETKVEKKEVDKSLEELNNLKSYTDLRESIKGGQDALFSISRSYNKEVVVVLYKIGEEIYVFAKQNKITQISVIRGVAYDLNMSERNVKRYIQLYKGCEDAGITIEALLEEMDSRGLAISMTSVLKYLGGSEEDEEAPDEDKVDTRKYSIKEIEFVLGQYIPEKSKISLIVATLSELRQK